MSLYLLKAMLKADSLFCFFISIFKASSRDIFKSWALSAALCSKDILLILFSKDLKSSVLFEAFSSAATKSLISWLTSLGLVFGATPFLTAPDFNNFSRPFLLPSYKSSFLVNSLMSSTKFPSLSIPGILSPI